MSFIPTGVVNFTSNTTAFSYDVTLPSGIAAGTQVYVCIGVVGGSVGVFPGAVDNASGGSNTYVVDGTQPLQFNGYVAILSSLIANALVAGNKITITVDTGAFPGSADAIAVAIYTTDPIPSPYVSVDPTNTIRYRGFTTFDAGGGYSTGFPHVISINSPGTDFRQKLSIGIVGWGAGQTAVETFSPDFTHLDSFTIASGIDQATISISYALNTNPTTQYETTSISGGGGASLKKYYSWLSVFWVTISQTKKLDCKRDNKRNRRYTAAINSSGNAVIYNDDDITTTNTSALTPIIVDTDTTCDFPNIHVLDSGKILYTYVKSATIYYRISKDLGATWSAAVAITAGYTAHDLGTDFSGFIPIIPAYNQSDQHIYIITGQPNGAGGITWNAPVDTGLVARETSPAILVLPDGTFELTYMDQATNNITIARCKKLRANGVGTWI